MVGIEEFYEIAEELYNELPRSIYDGLNGGIIIEEEHKLYPNEPNLTCMGVYERSLIGKCIRIYYGSFINMYPWYDREEMKNAIRETLHHEITHHLEFLANEKDLEIEDMKFLHEYRKKREEIDE